jgi:hypothetical protein
MMASAKFGPPSRPDAPGISGTEETFEIVKNHPLLPWVKSYFVGLTLAPQNPIGILERGLPTR